MLNDRCFGEKLSRKGVREYNFTQGGQSKLGEVTSKQRPGHLQ